MADSGVAVPMEIQILDIGMTGGVTICSICGDNVTSEEEDLVLLCDGKGCTNEIHMYCLKPMITAVPEGDWYCPVCDINGTTVHLNNLLQSQEDAFSKEVLKNREGYQQYLAMIQQNYYPLEDWRPNTLDCRVISEFDVSSSDLIGMPVRVFSEVDDQYHTGRIISRRHNGVTDRWEHLMQFRRYQILINDSMF
jgi:hypothetical protein